MGALSYSLNMGKGLRYNRLYKLSWLMGLGVTRGLRGVICHVVPLTCVVLLTTLLYYLTTVWSTQGRRHNIYTHVMRKYSRRESPTASHVEMWCAGWTRFLLRDILPADIKHRLSLTSLIMLEIFNLCKSHTSIPTEIRTHKKFLCGQLPRATQWVTWPCTHARWADINFKRIEEL